MIFNIVLTDFPIYRERHGNFQINDLLSTKMSSNVLLKTTDNINNKMRLPTRNLNGKKT